MLQGFLNVNKPPCMTSHTAVSILRRVTGIKQIGHAGTLDPAASGVLPIAVGKASKLIDYLPSDKRYTAVIEFGKRSDTCDLEGKVEILNAEPVNSAQIERVLPLFRGEIKQIPPAFSAVHYNGRRLYELAREGRIPDDIPERTVNIYGNEIIDFDEKQQRLKLDIICSKGTYIRSIASDLGAALNTGALLYSLIRTEAGGMKIEDALILNENLKKEEIEQHLINPAAVLKMKNYEINENEYKAVLNGNKIKNRFGAENNILLMHNEILTVLAYAEKDFVQPKKLMI